jgi:hypothetical protein
MRGPTAVVAGLLVGTISSMLGVAGGEFIIPILIFVFGADIQSAGTADVLISLPIVLTGVGRHLITGHYRSQAMLAYLAIPMCIGSVIGATIGVISPLGHRPMPCVSSSRSYWPDLRSSSGQTAARHPETIRQPLALADCKNP